MGCEYSKMHEFLKNHLNTDLWTIYQAIIKPRIWFERSSIGKTHASILDIYNPYNTYVSDVTMISKMSQVSNERFREHS